MDFVTKKEIAETLNYSEDEVQDLVDRKQIPFHVFNGKDLRFPKQDVLSQIKPREKKRGKSAKNESKE